MRVASLLLLCWLSAVGLPAKEKPAPIYEIPLPPKPDFSALSWLLGEWTGKTTGTGPSGEIRLTVSLELDGRFMLFREEVSLAATKAAPALKESWMGVLSDAQDRTEFILSTFSTTGFVTRYRVLVQEGEIRLNPEGGDRPPPGWLFRRALERSGDGALSETVQVAPPSRSFFDYYSARLTRTVPAPKAASLTQNPVPGVQ